MDIRRAVFIVVLLLVPAAVHADRHRADLMAGGFRAKGSDFTGWQLSGSWPILPCRDLSLVGSFGRYKGTESDDQADHTLATYIIGGRWTFHGKWLGREMLPFVQLLGGGVDNIRELGGDLREVKTHAIAVFGVGVQPSFQRESPNALDPRPRWRFRVQLDLFHRWREELGGFKPGGFGAAASLGLVYQFGPEFKCERDAQKPGDQKKACAPSPPPPRARAAARVVPSGRRGPPAPGERIAVGAR